MYIDLLLASWIAFLGIFWIFINTLLIVAVYTEVLVQLEKGFDYIWLWN